MKTQSSDTHPDIERRLIAGYRAMTPTQKLQSVWDLHRLAHDLAMADVRKRYPDAGDRECLLRVASRYLDPDLLAKATGWDPRVKGY